MKPDGFRGQAVAGVVIRGQSILLVRSAKRGGIELPGGRVRGLWRDDGEPETDLAAVAREVFEETGVRVGGQATYLGWHSGIDFDCRFYCYLSSAGEPRPGDDASESFWGTPQDLRGGTGPSDLSMAMLAVHVACGACYCPVVPAAEIKRARQAARRSVLEAARRQRDVERAEATASARVRSEAYEAQMEQWRLRSRPRAEERETQMEQRVPAERQIQRIAGRDGTVIVQAPGTGEALLLTGRHQRHEPAVRRSLSARALMVLAASMSLGSRINEDDR